MKRTINFLVFTLLLVLLIGSARSSQAQGKSKDTHNSKGSKKEAGPPPWAPAHGYRAKTRYVYFKDYNVYYDNSRGVYISVSGGKWIVSAKIPSSISGIDLVAAVKIDLDVDGDEPQRYNADHKKKYPSSRK